MKKRKEKCGEKRNGFCQMIVLLYNYINIKYLISRTEIKASHIKKVPSVLS